MSMNSLERLSFIDILKIISTFAIVLLHVSAIYVRMDAQLLNPSGAPLHHQRIGTHSAAALYDDFRRIAAARPLPI